MPLRSIGDDGTSDGPVFPEKQGGIASQAIKPDPSADITITDPHGDKPDVDPAPGTESEVCGHQFTLVADRDGADRVTVAIFACEAEFRAISASNAMSRTEQPNGQDRDAKQNLQKP